LPQCGKNNNSPISFFFVLLQSGTLCTEGLGNSPTKEQVCFTQTTTRGG
jgi:hypothetical protein